MGKKTLIGNTPMIKINYEYLNKKYYTYAKLEYFNLTGSIKDRVVYYILNKAKKNNILKDNMPLIEATSGNTGIAISALGCYYHHPVYIFMPNTASKERVLLMKAFNANVILFSKEEGGFKRCVAEAKKLAEEKNGFLVNQFKNIDNIMAHYTSTGKEIIDSLNEDIYAFISGIGTGGTLFGTSKRLKEKFKDLKIVAIEPDKMPLIKYNKIIGNHKIEGIGDEFIPDLVDKSLIDDVILINDNDAINMSRKIAKELGIGVGISSGANFIGSVLTTEKLDKPVATVFADDNKKYLSTDLLKDIDNNKDFISNKIKLIDYEVI